MKTGNDSLNIESQENINPKSDSSFTDMAFGLTSVKGSMGKKESTIKQMDAKVSKGIFLGSGSVQYDGIYRSLIDTPFKETGIIQHLITIRANISINENIPLSVTYFQRETNSQFFRDYKDFRIEFNPMMLEELKQRKFQSIISKISKQNRDLNVKSALSNAYKQVADAEDFSKQPKLVNRLIESRVIVLFEGKVPRNSDTVVNTDSMVRNAKTFISIYDSVQLLRSNLIAYTDSLKKEYVTIEKRLLTIKELLFKRTRENTKDQEKLSSLLKQEGYSNKDITRITEGVSSIRKFAIGRVNPNLGDLTVKNVNINGIDFEYNRRIYFALAAGIVNFRSRDFYYIPKSASSQFIYATKFGYGKKENTHFYITAFKGKKQLYSSGTSSNSMDIYGIGFESKINIHKNHFLFGEVAQSSANNLLSNNLNKPSFKLKDKANKAVSVRWFSHFPSTKSRIELFYQYRGIDFQNFTNYYNNAILNSWYFKANQYLWNKRVQLLASVTKNSFENPYMATVYSGSTILKNFQAIFRYKNFPSFSFGFMPSSQLSMINGQLTEHIFNSLQSNASHQYRIGTARGFSSISFQRFYNNSKDAGYVYFNSRNLFITQNFQFSQHSATINLLQSNNPINKLIVIDAGANTNLKNGIIAGGVKLNSLNNEDVQIGYYFNLKASIFKSGHFSFGAENAFVPGNKQLFKSQFFLIGFSKNFN